MRDKIQVYDGLSVATKGNHSGMPSRDNSYLPTDERGHIQASSLGGNNSRENVVAQSKDVNHGGYYSMEGGERAALKDGNSVWSEKIAFASNQPGNRPDVFMVNDTVTNTAGQSQNIHLSFTNMTYAEQESMNQTSMSQASDLLAASQNPGDTLRDSISNEEYTCLMEETDAALPNIDEMYGEWTFVENSEIESSEHDMDVAEADTGDIGNGGCEEGAGMEMGGDM